MVGGFIGVRLRVYFKSPGPSPLAALHARRLTTTLPGQALCRTTTPKNTLRRTPDKTWARSCI